MFEKGEGKTCSRRVQRGNCRFELVKLRVFCINFLAQLVERALLWHCRGHGLESRWNHLNFSGGDKVTIA